MCLAETSDDQPQRRQRSDSAPATEQGPSWSQRLAVQNLSSPHDGCDPERRTRSCAAPGRSGPRTRGAPHQPDSPGTPKLWLLHVHPHPRPGATACARAPGELLCAGQQPGLQNCCCLKSVHAPDPGSVAAPPRPTIRHQCPRGDKGTCKLTRHEDESLNQHTPSGGKASRRSPADFAVRAQEPAAALQTPAASAAGDPAIFVNVDLGRRSFTGTAPRSRPLSQICHQ